MNGSVDGLLKNARRIASLAHEGQLYGGEFPYVIHLQAVESVLLRFEVFDTHARSVAWLHDYLEDTDGSYEYLSEFFPQLVVDAVADLTEPKGGNRKWRHEQTYPRIRRNPLAVLVKFADRIANVESGGSKVGMYRKEHKDFKNSLYHPFEWADYQYARQIDFMMAYLDELMIRFDRRKISTIEVS